MCFLNQISVTLACPSCLCSRLSSSFRGEVSPPCDWLFTSQQQGSYPHPICSWVTWQQVGLLQSSSSPLSATHPSLVGRCRRRWPLIPAQGPGSSEVCPASPSLAASWRWEAPGPLSRFSYASPGRAGEEEGGGQLLEPQYTWRVCWVFDLHPQASLEGNRQGLFMWIGSIWLFVLPLYISTPTYNLGGFLDWRIGRQLLCAF